jgi:hypothetical protein
MIIKAIDLVLCYALNEHFMPLNACVVPELIFSFRSQRIAISIWKLICFFYVTTSKQSINPQLQRILIELCLLMTKVLYVCHAYGSTASLQLCHDLQCNPKISRMLDFAGRSTCHRQEIMFRLYLSTPLISY